MKGLIDELHELTHKETQSHDNAPLFVSLYIVLLAFFIMLNTIATPTQEKTNDIVKSVKNTFAYRKPVDFQISNPSSDKSGSAMTSFFDAVRQHSQALLPINDLDVTQAGNLLQITLPNEALFTSDGSLTPQATDMLKGYSNAMLRWRSGVDISVEIISHSPQGSMINFFQGGSHSDAIKRSGMITRKITSYSVPASFTAAGLKMSNASVTSFRFAVSFETQKALAQELAQ